jgi:RNA polymerase sigma factor (sigma-70 family)
MATLFGLGAAGTFSDAQLLDQFAEGIMPGSEQAFAALVERHGRMVLATCRAVLRDEHAAQDTCQATFLVLARKARSLRVHGSLGPWLHLVAMRAARSAGSSSRRRRVHEAVAAGRNRERVEPADGLGLDAGAVHEEIGRLPERYRGPIVLCELEGQPLEHAARSLGCPVGTVKSRLSRGRLILHARLSGRGLDPSRAVGVAVGLGRVAVPAEMVADLARSAELVRAGLGLASGLIPATAIESASLVLRSLSMITAKTILMTSVAAAIVAAGAAANPQQQGAAQATTTPTQAGDAPKPAESAPSAEVKDRVPPTTSDEVRQIQGVLDQLQARIRQLEARPESTLAPTPPGSASGKPRASVGSYGIDKAGNAVDTTRRTPKTAAVNEAANKGAAASEMAGPLVPEDRPDSVPAPVLRNIKVDGDLDDWPVAMPRYSVGKILMQPLDEVGTDGVRNADLSTSPDLSASFSVGYDPTTQLLYLAVTVRDDHLIIGHDSYLDTDALEVYVDGLRSDHSIAAPPSEEAIYATLLPTFPVLQYIGLPGSGRVYGRPKQTNPILMGGDLEKTGTKMAYRRKGDATIYEWAIQAFDRYPDEPTKLTPGKRIGFDLAVIDKDLPATSPSPPDGSIGAGVSWLYWGPTWKGQKLFDAGALGEIVLGK